MAPAIAPVTIWNKIIIVNKRLPKANSIPIALRFSTAMSGNLQLQIPITKSTTPVNWPKVIKSGVASQPVTSAIQIDPKNNDPKPLTIRTIPWTLKSKLRLISSP